MRASSDAVSQHDTSEHQLFFSTVYTNYSFSSRLILLTSYAAWDTILLAHFLQLLQSLNPVYNWLTVLARKWDSNCEQKIDIYTALALETFFGGGRGGIVQYSIICSGSAVSEWTSGFPFCLKVESS